MFGYFDRLISGFLLVHQMVIFSRGTTAFASVTLIDGITIVMNNNPNIQIYASQLLSSVAVVQLFTSILTAMEELVQ